jgi:hypothetical protein
MLAMHLFQQQIASELIEEGGARPSATIQGD